MSDLESPWNLESVPVSNYGFALKVSSQGRKEKPNHQE